MSYDIVYILKEGINSEELRYSLRSVCKNFDYNQIWFYCGCPKDIKPDRYVPFKQEGYNKLDRVHNTMQAICENEEITENFYLFNDDFFIMQPYEQEVALSNGSLYYVAHLIENINKNESFYTQYLKYTAKLLSEQGYDTLSYACHVPLLVNREKGLKVLKFFPNNTLFRSIYGNYYNIGGKLIDDVKIVTLNDVPSEDCILLSTNEKSFEKGKVGEFIRERFPEPCKYEVVKKISFKKEQKVLKTSLENNDEGNLIEAEDIKIIEETKFEKFKKSLYNKCRKIKEEWFTFPYEE